MIAKLKSKFNWDALGIFTSLACAVHCAVLPLLLTSFPLFGVNIIDNFAFEVFMILLAGGIGIYSLSHGFRHSHNFLPVSMFFGGIVALVLKQIWHESQLWFLIPAVLLILSAHLMNYFTCRKAKRADAGA